MKPGLGQNLNLQKTPPDKLHVLPQIALVAAPLLLFAAAGTVVGLATLPGAVLINLGYILVIITGGVLLKRQGSSWLVIGLAKPAGWWKTVLQGFGAWISAVMIFVLAQVVIITVLKICGQSIPELDQSRFNPLEGNLALFLLMLLLAWTTIAFGEELFYRAFLLSQMVDHTALSNRSAILISALVFGMVHFAEGPLGIINNGAFGVFFGWIYIKSGRNLWITLIGHGLLNTFRFTLLYLGSF